MRRKVLFVASIPTHPCDAGNRARMLALSRSTRALGYDVHFVYLKSWSWESADLVAMRAEFGPDNFHLIHAKPPAFPRGSMPLLRRIKRRLDLKSGFDYPLDSWYDSGSTVHLLELEARFSFDVVIVEYVFSSAAFRAFGAGCVKILDTHDIFADRSAKRTGDGKRLSWYSTSLQEEEVGLRRADVVFTMQEVEETLIRNRLGAAPPSVTTVGYMPEIKRVKPPYNPSASFFSAGNEANRSALRYFIERVMPLIRERLPNFTLFVGGSICSSLVSSKDVHLVGRVDTPSEILRRAPIAINPVQVGTGMNIKLLDALGAGVPTVTSESGVRGLGEQYQGGVCIVADRDPEGFAAATVKLLTDLDAWEFVSEAASAAAHTWNHKQLTQLRSALAIATAKHRSYFDF